MELILAEDVSANLLCANNVRFEFNDWIKRRNDVLAVKSPLNPMPADTLGNFLYGLIDIRPVVQRKSAALLCGSQAEDWGNRTPKFPFNTLV